MAVMAMMRCLDSFPSESLSVYSYGAYGGLPVPVVDMPAGPEPKPEVEGAPNAEDPDVAVKVELG